MPVSVQFVLPSPGKVIFEIRLDRSIAKINKGQVGVIGLEFAESDLGYSMGRWIAHKESFESHGTSRFRVSGSFLMQILMVLPKCAKSYFSNIVVHCGSINGEPTSRKSHK